MPGMGKAGIQAAGREEAELLIEMRGIFFFRRRHKDIVMGGRRGSSGKRT